jgi:hypothetical protein
VGGVAAAVHQIERNSIVSWSAAAVATDVNGEVVLMNLERDRCYGLGATGSSVWRQLANPVLVSEVVSQLSEEYEAAPGMIEADLLRTLAELHSEGLVQVHPEG